MIFNSNSAVGFQCSVCGSIETQKIDIFKLSGQKKAAICCQRCGKSEVGFTRRRGRLTVSVPCSCCGYGYSVEIKVGRLVASEPQTYNCPMCGETVLCFGEAEKLAALQNSLFAETELGHMYAMADSCGVGNDMLDILEHLKDMAMQGMMYCECGETEIEVELHGSLLRFVCPNCNAKLDIRLTDSSSVKDFKSRRKIILKR